MSTPMRTTLRQASTAARQRQSRTHRLTRHTCFTMKRTGTFQVRKSLVEYVDAELTEMQTSVFYQRIFILAKNGCLEPEPEPEPEVPTAGQEPPPSSVPEPEVITVEVEAAAAAEPPDENTQASTTEGSQPQTEGTSEAVTDASADGPTVTLPTLDAAQGVNAEADPETITHTFRFTDDFALQPTAGDEEEDEEEEAEPESEPEPVKAKEYFETFCEKLQELHRNCLQEAFTPDPVCGLYIYMGDYALLMLETSEDMMGCYCRQLRACSDEFWLSNRVFHIEDHITQLYTKELTFRRIPGVFLNEKFPTSTPTDEYLMGKQHMIIKEKLFIICRLIAESLAPPEPIHDADQLLSRSPSISQSRPTSVHRLRLEEEKEQEEELEQEQEQEKGELGRSISAVGSLKSKSSQHTEFLAVDVYRKFLPEIQRIELVLASTRFYFTLAEFSDLYGSAPQTPDEDGLFWPIQNNYTPPNIFRRTPFDINLTFADYVADKMKTDSDHHRASQEDFGEEEEVPQAKQRPAEEDDEAQAPPPPAAD
ncbi:uncharacterized protein LOC111067587 [Drosophila obscura]|uniref:uncharacterized protein LOC111067587 n=1 Tax=Drosophila obscura TaxID=7282 RepID=UPI001BB26C79|nr:uncharacterized protein LOC111067587 [Drosophila obscura]